MPGPTSVPTPWYVLVEEAGAAIGGALASDFLGAAESGSRAGRALVRQQRLTQQRQTALTRWTDAVSRDLLRLK